MNPRKNSILVVLLGLLLFASSAALGQQTQTPAQTDPKKTESSCASCDCCGESCDMSKHDGKMKHDSKGHKDGDCCKMKSKDKDKDKDKNKT